MSATTAYTIHNSDGTVYELTISARAAQVVSEQGLRVTAQSPRLMMRVNRIHTRAWKRVREAARETSTQFDHRILADGGTGVLGQ